MNIYMPCITESTAADLERKIKAYEYLLDQDYIELSNIQNHISDLKEKIKRAKASLEHDRITL